MVICYLCKKIIPSMAGFKLHLEIFHNNVHCYKCVENGCDRSFQLFFSFKRHYLNSHCLSENITVVRPTNELEIVANNSNNHNSDELVEKNTSSSNGTEGFQTCFSNQEPAKVLEKSLSTFIAKLYADPVLPRSCVGMVVSGFQNVIKDAIIPAVQNCADNAVSKAQLTPDTSKHFVENLTNVITSPFDTLKTERRRINYFTENETYIPPQSIVIGQRLDSKKSDGVNRIESVNCVEQFIPLRHVLKRFFSLNNLLSETLNYINKLSQQSDTIENFIQGSFWQGKRAAHNGRLVFPLFVFFDDYETGNVLGSHAGLHKLGAVYISVACLPPHRQSSISNIFLALLFHSNDRTKFGNNVVFKPLIDELNYLQDIGVDIDVPDFKGVVYFETGLILGDNLGIHSITGFVESFSSNFPCRVCKVPKVVLHKQLYENESLLRNSTNYAADLLIGNPSLTGIKETCVWLKIKDFDLFHQVGVDIMHDILEGVAKYVISFILVTFVETFKFFSLETLNDRIITFPYGPDLKNKPCVLELHHLKNDNVRLSASEMLTFLRFFGIIVGEFVPKDNPIWSMYITLRKVLDILLTNSVPIGAGFYLQTLVAELNEKYISNTKKNLKPKFHTLIHYHSMLNQFGPLVNIWSMRYEAKHRPSKLSAKASCNKRNITLTLAMKHQLQLNEMFSKENLDDPIKIGPFCQVTDFEICEVRSKLKLDTNKSLKCVKWVSVTSTRYEKDIVLAHYLEEEGYLVCFMIVSKIYLYDSKTIIVSGKRLKTVGFEDHYFAYEVVLDVDLSPIFVILSKLLSHVPTAKPFNVHNKSYVVLRGPV